MNTIKECVMLKEQIHEFFKLISHLNAAPTYVEKLEILNSLRVVKNYLTPPLPIRTFLQGLNTECEYAIKSIIAIGQAPIVFNMQHVDEDKFERLRVLLKLLLNIENFYQPIGGIIGYHATILRMLVEQSSSASEPNMHYVHPEGMKLDEDTKEVRQAIKWGIESLPRVAEIYPVGGAGDRLNLTDEISNTPLPAALLPFNGLTLIEGLVRDQQAREYLYFKLFDKQLTTPIAMMTSSEKNNHAHILNICQSRNWFGRAEKSFFFFIQPLVPVLTIEGNWSMSGPLTLTLKPGGHGVIWKLAQELGVFNWLFSQNYDKSLIRQINNPLAGTDFSILALMGVGCHEKKSFGFISCERLLNSAEGTNVLIEKQTQQGYEYCLTNIEYTDFKQRGIGETPLKPGSPYSTYPANTNILFADLRFIQKALKRCIIPGQIINFKTKVSQIDASGNSSFIEGGRLESTMQNIADCIIDRFPNKLEAEKLEKSLHTFILYNSRNKTISTTKKSYKPGESSLGTPEQALYDMLINNKNLLEIDCGFQVPELNTFENYMKEGPNFLFLYHPALGPLYSIIAQKIRKGQIAFGSELKLEIAETNIYDLNLNGSLIIESTSPLGMTDSTNILRYGGESRCRLQHVKVNNKGIDRTTANCFWKQQINRLEKLHIVLNEGSEFEAANVSFEGSFYFEVPSHHRLRIQQDPNGHLIEEIQPISKPNWYWQYAFDENHRIHLELIEN